MNAAVLRLVLAGSRSQWGRLVGITGGVAVGVLLLLCLVAASDALQTRELRGSLLSPAGEQVVDLRDDTVLVLPGTERFRERTIERVDVASTPESSVDVPGIGTAPRPGTAVLSPALAALVDAAPADELGDRYGTVVGVLPPSVLTGPDALVAVVGVDAATLADPAVGARTVAAWFKARPEVARVLHPAFEDCPGHANWKRDFTGAGGLFSVVFDARYSEAQVDRMVDALRLFGIGYSWGGPNSLVMPYRIKSLRDKWTDPGVLVRFNVGLEDPADLIADLERAFGQL